MIYTWKILEGIAPKCWNKIIHINNAGSPVPSPPIKNCTSIREGSIQIRGPQLFNNLPVNIRSQTGCSVASFKHKLDKYLQNIPDKNTRIHNQIRHKFHNIYEEFQRKLSNTTKAESLTWLERLYS